MAFVFMKLDVYQCAHEFVREAVALVDGCGPKHYALADQLRRASLSIPTNIAEGYGRWHIKEKSQFYRIALGSINECAALLDSAFRQNLLTAERHNELILSLDRIAKMTQRLIQAVQRRKI